MFGLTAVQVLGIIAILGIGVVLVYWEKVKTMLPNKLPFTSTTAPEAVIVEKDKDVRELMYIKELKKRYIENKSKRGQDAADIMLYDFFYNQADQQPTTETTAHV